MEPSLSGPKALPSPRSKDAPFFSGNMCDPLEYFLGDYEELAKAHQLSDAQKVKTIIFYVSAKLRDYWKSFDGYATSNWVEFRRSLQAAYPDLDPRNIFTKQRLYDYVRQTSRTRMRDEQDVLVYYGHFAYLSTMLANVSDFSDTNKNLAFWYGFHPEDRQDMAPRLIAKLPDQRADDPYPMSDVFDIARIVFATPERFLWPPWDHPFPIPIPDRESSPWDTDNGDPRNRDWRTTKCEILREPPCDRFREDPLPRESVPPPHQAPRVETKAVPRKKPTRAESPDLVELLDKMYGLSVRDRAYTPLYLQCLSHYPELAVALPKPEIPWETSDSLAYSTSATVPTSSNSTPSLPLDPAGTTPTFTDSGHSSSSCTGSRPNSCAFCALPGHFIRSCAAAQEYCRTGRATISNNRLCLPNGQPVPNGYRGGLKAGIDAWIAAQSPASATQSTSLGDSLPRVTLGFVEVRSPGQGGPGLLLLY